MGATLELQTMGPAEARVRITPDLSGEADLERHGTEHFRLHRMSLTPRDIRQALGTVLLPATLICETSGGEQMKQIITVIAALAAGTVFATAQDVKVEKKVEERPGVNVQVPAPGVGVERRERTETTGRASENCDKKTVEKDTPAGSSTVTKKRCD